MEYRAFVSKDGATTVAEFPDCPGCQTQAGPGESIAARAREALVGWLEAHLVLGRVPLLPSSPPRRAPPGWRSIAVSVPVSLALRIQLRAARHRAGLTQEALAQKVGVSQQQIAGLESPDANITLATLQRVAEALEQDVSVSLAPRGPVEDRGPR